MHLSSWTLQVSYWLAERVLLRALARSKEIVSRYNGGVATPAPHKPPPEDDHHQHHHRHAAYAAEATGLLLMGVLLLILIIIRYWSNIPWSAR